MKPKAEQVYKHFKGNLYRVLTLAVDSETGEEMVVYKALYGEETVYVRSLSMFMSEVDREKYPDVTQKMRFELQEEEENNYVDPLVMEFLETESMKEKCNILTALHHRITDDMITTMAISMDVVIEEGDLQDRYRQLMTCLTMMDKYESGRM